MCNLAVTQRAERFTTVADGDGTTCAPLWAGFKKFNRSLALVKSADPARRHCAVLQYGAPRDPVMVNNEYGDSVSTGEPVALRA